MEPTGSDMWYPQAQQFSKPTLVSTRTPQVFQVDQSEVVKMLQQMMEEMRSWRNPAPPQVKPLFFYFLVLTLLRDCSLCWDHWEVVQTPHTNQALP